MIVKTSKKMVNEMRKYCTDKNIEEIRLCTFSPDAFRWHVDCISDHENDYNISTGRYQVIGICYKSDCYCAPRYLTTDDLIRAFRRSDRTFESFFKNVFDDLAI